MCFRQQLYRKYFTPILPTLTFAIMGVRLGDFVCLTKLDIISLCLEFSKQFVGLLFTLKFLTFANEVWRARNDIVIKGGSCPSLNKIVAVANTWFSNYARLIGLFSSSGSNVRLIGLFSGSGSNDSPSVSTPLFYGWLWMFYLGEWWM